jgi:tetratricopeptide (TPR) repeat protein
VNEDGEASDERLLWRRLAVFAGGGTRIAVEAICAGEGLAAGVVPGLLAHLLDQALITIAQCGEEARYSLAPAAFPAAHHHLVASGEENRLRQRHAAYYLALVTELGRSLATSGQRAMSLDRLGLEEGNVRVATEWLADHGETEAAFRLLAILRPSFVDRGRVREGRIWLADLLERPTFGGRTELRARTLDHVGAIAFAQGNHGAARDAAEESLAIRRELGDPLPIAQSLNHLAGILRAADGDDRAARALLEESRSLAQEAGHAFLAAAASMSLGMLALDRGDLTDARSLLRQGAHTYLALQRVTTIPVILESHAKLAAAEGRTRTALRLAGAAARQREVLGVAAVAHLQADLDRHLAVARAALGAAGVAEAWAEGQALVPAQALAEALGEDVAPWDA